MKTLPEIMQQLKDLKGRVMAIEAGYAMSSDYESHKFMTHLDNINIDLIQIIDDCSDYPGGESQREMDEMEVGDELFVYTTPYAVICHGHNTGPEHCGTVCLTEAQYMHQLSRCDSGWQCPKCGASALWDDNCPATN